MIEKVDIGKQAEELVHRICEKMFLPDFVIRNPKFKTGGGIENEIADTLVLFKDTLIGFQVKAKKEVKKASEKNDTDIKRIYRRITSGIKQLGSIKSALDTNEAVDVTNSMGTKIQLDSSKVNKIVGVVIIDLVGEEQFPENEQSEILGGFSYRGNMPVHIFMRSDIELVAPELDTLPDFLEYLKVREQLYAREILIPYTSERDLLALYKMHPNMIQSALNGEPDVLAIGEGLWESYVTKYSIQRHQRDIDNSPSYFIDKIISEVHKSIGFTGFIPDRSLRNDIAQGTVDNYFAAIGELASLTRLERRACGENLIPCLKRADKNGYAYSLYFMREKNKAILMMSSTKSRQQRSQELYSIAAMAYCKFGLQEFIGIATENYSVLTRSYDFVLMKGVSFENERELTEGGKKLFGNIRQVRHSEYAGHTVIKSAQGSKNTKIGRNEPCPCGSEKKYKKCCLK